jgi:hypothetical protein
MACSSLETGMAKVYNFVDEANNQISTFFTKPKDTLNNLLNNPNSFSDSCATTTLYPKYEKLSCLKNTFLVPIKQFGEEVRDFKKSQSLKTSFMHSWGICTKYHSCFNFDHIIGASLSTFYFIDVRCSAKIPMPFVPGILIMANSALNTLEHTIKFFTEDLNKVIYFSTQGEFKHLLRPLSRISAIIGEFLTAFAGLLATIPIVGAFGAYIFLIIGSSYAEIPKEIDNCIRYM